MSTTRPSSRKLDRWFRRLVALALPALVAAPSLEAQVINEWVANHTGSPDAYEYVEIFGEPDTDYSGFSLLHIEGDLSTSTGTIGNIDRVYPLGTTDADGYWTTGFLSEQLENGTMALLLVEGFTGAVGDDVDADNDGVLDTSFWTTLVDDVAVTDGNAGDGLYSATVLEPYFDGAPYTPGGASRIPNGVDTDSLTDWMRNDFDGCGLPGFTGYLDANEACNTPGSENSTVAPPPTGPVLNEWLAEHVGDPDDHEFIELAGDPLASYAFACVVVLVGDAGAAGVVDAAFPAGTTDGSGYWSTGFLTGELEDGSYTILVAEWSGCALAVGSDLDADDDGVIDSPPWTQVYDSVAVNDGGAGDLAYSDTVLGPAYDGLAGPPPGASRVPDRQDTDAPADWRRNDFDGAGLPGFAGGLESGEAYNTPGWLNRIGVDDYYAAVDASLPTTLRATLHETIDDHRRFEYTDDATDTWDVLESADEDPGDLANILDVYKNASYPKQGGGNSYYSREHTWAKSYGFPDLTPDNSPYTDCHHLFLCDSSYNGSRGNNPFRTCDPAVNAACQEMATDVNNGTGGSPGSGHPGYSDWVASGSWETWIGRRGDVARAQMYMDVRYEGGVHGVTGTAEPDLILTDDEGLIAASATGSNEAVGYMGILSELLQWHRDDPVDEVERRRNEVVYSYQGNRNPFVDHPEWADCLFAGVNCGLLFADGFESGTLAGWTLSAP